jgi:hypothetical protein
MKGLAPPTRGELAPRPSSRPGIRLAPLPHNVHDSVSALSGAEPMSPARSHSGHLATMKHMRRSVPAAPSDWGLLATSHKDSLSAPCKRMAALVTSLSESDAATSSELMTPPRAQPSLRVRRSRRPADFGANLGSSYGSRDRGRSCTSTTAVALDMRASPTLSRCDSVPAIGTAKSDGEAVSRAKAGAVAALQRLFFEEMAKNGHDANDAAARALRRLTEVPCCGSSSNCVGDSAHA